MSCRIVVVRHKRTAADRGHVVGVGLCPEHLIDQCQKFVGVRCVPRHLIGKGKRHRGAVPALPLVIVEDRVLRSVGSHGELELENRPGFQQICPLLQPDPAWVVGVLAGKQRALDSRSEKDPGVCRHDRKTGGREGGCGENGRQSGEPANDARGPHGCALEEKLDNKSDHQITSVVVCQVVTSGSFRISGAGARGGL